MNRLVKVVYWLLGSLLMSCSTGDTNRIGVLFPHNPDDKETIWAKASQHIADEYGATTEIIIQAAGLDAGRQHQQSQEMLEQGLDVLILAAVNANTAAAIVRQAQDAGVPVIAFDRMVSHSLPDFYVSYEYTKAGQLMAEYALENRPEGNYVTLWGDRGDHNATLVKQGQEELLVPRHHMGRINWLYKAFVDSWSYENAYSQMNQVLEHTTDTIDAVLASNDRIAKGAYEALASHGLANEVLITGMDAELAACRRIIEGKQTCTIYKSIIRQADAAMQVAFEIMENGTATSDITVTNDQGQIPARLLTPVLVDRHNILETVVKDGLYTREQLMQ